MENKYFNIHIFLDALKRLKLIGIFTTIIFCIEAAAVPIAYYINYKSYTDDSYTISVVDFLDIHPIIVFLVFIITPIMILYMFSFLNNRIACDYYHSVPQKRSCVYISMLSGVIAWIIIIILISSVVSLIGSQFVTECYTINMSSVPIFMLDVFAGSMFVAAAMSIAMFITGTIFNNIIVSLIILFFPRIILLFITLMVTECAPVFSYDFLPPILNFDYNIIFGFISSFVDYDNSSIMTQYIGSICTIVVSFIYFFIAAILFKKRKSETAGHSAPNKYLQAAYRIIIALLICLIPLYIILEGYAYDSESLFAIIILYIIAIFAYFIYDIIATRKLSNLKKTLPGLGILVICNIILAIVVLATINATLSYTPDSDEISYIKISNYSVSDYYDYDDIDATDYFMKQTENVKISNDELNELISEKLEETCETIENDEFSYDYDYSLQIIINSGGIDHYRVLYFSDSEMAEIADILSNEADFTEAYMTLPSDDSIYSISLDGTELSEKDALELLDLYRSEIQNMDFGEWYSILSGNLSDDYFTLDTLEILYNIGTTTYCSEIPITTETEELANKYLELSYENTLNDMLDAIKIINPDTSDDISDWYISIYSGNTYSEGEIYGDELEFSAYKCYNDYENSDSEAECTLTNKEEQKLYDIIYDSLQTTPTVSDNLVEINLDIYNNETYDDEYYTFYINLSDENYEKLMTLTNES